MALNKLKTGTALSTQITEQNDNITIIESHLAENASKHITESGSNTNGSYIKFDDGTMICDVVTPEMGTPTAVDNVFQTAGVDFVSLTFPAIFYDENLKTTYGIKRQAGTPFGMYFYTVKTTSINYISLVGATATSSGICYIRVIGRWKA